MKGRLDLRTPCKNCPFRKDEGGIRFRSDLRALEIYLTADRHGFPCHKSAALEDDGYRFKKDGKTQNCVGALIFMRKLGHIWTGGTGRDRAVMSELDKRVSPDSAALVFDTLDEFLEANRG